MKLCVDKWRGTQRGNFGESIQGIGMIPNRLMERIDAIDLFFLLWNFALE